MTDEQIDLPAVARLYYSGDGLRRYKRASTRSGPGEPLCFVSVAKEAIRREVAQALNAAKDCRTCTRYVHAQCALPDGHSGCKNMSACVLTQPVRLWEK